MVAAAAEAEESRTLMDYDAGSGSWTDHEAALTPLRSTKYADEKNVENNEGRTWNQVNEDDTKPIDRIEIHLQESRNVDILKLLFKLTVFSNGQKQRVQCVLH